MKDYRSNHDVDRLRRLLASTPEAADIIEAGPRREAEGEGTRSSPAQGTRSSPAQGNPATKPRDTTQPAASPRAATATMQPRRAPRATRTGRPPRRIASGGVIGIVAAVIVIGPHFLRGSPTTNEATDPSNGVNWSGSAARTGVDPLLDPCPGTPPHNSPQRLAGLGLPAGAEAVRLCPATVNGGRSRWSPPTDALVTDVDGFIDTVDALPAASGQSSCPVGSLKGAAFIMALSYPGGRTVQLTAADSVCSDVQVGARSVSSALLLHTFMARLDAQRDAVSGSATR